MGAATPRQRREGRLEDGLTMAPKRPKTLSHGPRWLQETSSQVEQNPLALSFAKIIMCVYIYIYIFCAKGPIVGSQHRLRHHAGTSQVAEETDRLGLACRNVSCILPASPAL